MVTLHPITDKPAPHTLVARKDIKELKAGDIASMYIQKMTDGRFGVFSANYKTKFYTVIATEKELHETFNEQTEAFR